MRLIISAAHTKALLFLLCVSWANQASADEGEDPAFCAWAQQQIAGTSLVANVVTHTSYEDFVSSKASDAPLTVQQYWSNPVPGPDGMPRVVSCKMRTAERINHAQEQEASEANSLAKGDQSCDLVNRQVLANQLNRIPDDQLAVPVGSLKVDEEDSTYIGPMWLKPWPFQPLSRDDEGVLHIHSRALYVPFSWWIPMPDRFKGGYYCHLIAPDYLRAVLLGEVSPGG